MTRLLIVLAVVLGLSGLACTPAATPSNPAAPAPAVAQAPPAPAAPAQARPAAAPAAPQAPTPLPPRTIVIAAPATSLSFLPARLADEQGFFRAEGIEVDWQTMPPQLTVSALLADEVDYSTTPSSAAAAASQGAPVQIVYFMSGKLQHQLVGRPELTGVADLAGQRIAVNRLGDITAFEVRWVLDHYNIPDASLVTLGRDTERIAGVLSGAADVAVLPVPMDIVAERQGLRRLLAVGDVLEVPLAGLVVNEEKLHHDSNEIAAVVRAVTRGTQYLRDPANREAVAAFIANWADLSPDEGRSAFDRVRDTYLPAGMPTDAQMQLFLTMLRETGGATEAITVDQIADFGITRRVAAEMGVAP